MRVGMDEALGSISIPDRQMEELGGEGRGREGKEEDDKEEEVVFLNEWCGQANSQEGVVQV